MGYAAAGPTGDGWYVRVSDYRAGTYTYLGPFMSQEGMVEAAKFLRGFSHRPQDFNLQEYTSWHGVEDIPGVTNDPQGTYHTLTAYDVGKPYLYAFGRTWPVVNFIGEVLATDVGKRVFQRGDILQVENDEQRDSRAV